MAKWILYQNGTQVNTIEADAEFATRYAERMGYDIEEMPAPEPTELPPTPTEQLRADVDYIAAMTGVEL